MDLNNVSRKTVIFIRKYEKELASIMEIYQNLEEVDIVDYVIELIDNKIKQGFRLDLDFIKTELSKRFEDALIKEKQKNRQKLIENNLNLVKYIANQYLGNGVSFEDLFQDGCVALIRAVDGYNPTKGKFSAYATRAIKNKLQDSIIESRKVVFAPNNHIKEVFKLKKVKQQLEKELGMPPSLEQLAAKLNLSSEKTFNLMHFSIDYTSVSLNAPIGVDDLTFMDVISDDTILSSEDSFILKSMRIDVNNLLSILTDREKRILRLRYGLDDGECKKYMEIGELEGISDSRVSIIEKKALCKLRKKATKDQLMDYYKD